MVQFGEVLTFLFVNKSFFRFQSLCDLYSIKSLSTANGRMCYWRNKQTKNRTICLKQNT